jgi:hypothetical protein
LLRVILQTEGHAIFNMLGSFAYPLAICRAYFLANIKLQLHISTHIIIDHTNTKKPTWLQHYERPIWKGLGGDNNSGFYKNAYRQTKGQLNEIPGYYS